MYKPKTPVEEMTYGAIRGCLSCVVFFVMLGMIAYLWYGPAPAYITYPAVGVTEQNEVVQVWIVTKRRASSHWFDTIGWASRPPDLARKMPGGDDLTSIRLPVPPLEDASAPRLVRVFNEEQARELGYMP